MVRMEIEAILRDQTIRVGGPGDDGRRGGQTGDDEDGEGVTGKRW